MKITIYELLGMVKDEPDRSIYVKYFDRINKKEDVMWACKENIIYKLEQLIIELNDEVEIIEEEKELHANNIEFNRNNDKSDCIITLDENDLGIDKLHLDNCYFYKENDKWYVKKYDFKNFNLEEKKIPEEIECYHQYNECVVKDKFYQDQKGSLVDEIIIDKINDIIDYLKSKGE